MNSMFIRDGVEGLEAFKTKALKYFSRASFWKETQWLPLTTKTMIFVGSHYEAL